MRHIPTIQHNKNNKNNKTENPNDISLELCITTLYHSDHFKFINFSRFSFSSSFFSYVLLPSFLPSAVSYLTRTQMCSMSYLFYKQTKKNDNWGGKNDTTTIYEFITCDHIQSPRINYFSTSMVVFIIFVVVAVVVVCVCCLLSLVLWHELKMWKFE